jgi:hypothetical protein
MSHGSLAERNLALCQPARMRAGAENAKIPTPVLTLRAKEF